MGPPTFDLHAIMIRSLRWDIYLITAAPQNSSSWQLKGNPSLGYCYTPRYHQSVISMHSRSYSVMRQFNFKFLPSVRCLKLQHLVHWLVSQNNS